MKLFYGFPGDSLVEICLPTQEIQVWSLVWENPTCSGAIKPVCHNYRARAPEPENRNYWAHVLHSKREPRAMRSPCTATGEQPPPSTTRGKPLQPQRPSPDKIKIPRTVAHSAPPSMGFSRQEYWSGLPFPSTGNLSDPGIEPRFPTLQADSLPTEPVGKPQTDFSEKL